MESRKAQRTEFHQPLEFELSATVSYPDKIAGHEAEGRDISSGGLGMLTEDLLAAGSVVRLRLPISETVTLPVFAEVVWTHPVRDRFGVGMRFLY